MWLAQAGNSIGLVPLYYVVAILGVIGGGGLAMYRWQKSQRQQWLDEGVQAQKQADALTANTEAARSNTEAIGQLTTELHLFVTETRAQFSAQSGKIDQLNTRVDRMARRRRAADPPD